MPTTRGPRRRRATTLFVALLASCGTPICFAADVDPASTEGGAPAATVAVEPSRNIFASWFGGRPVANDGSFASSVAQVVAQPSPMSRTGELVDNALALLGINYRFGGTSPASGFDCSGMVGYVFRNALGMSLPRRAEEISRVGTKVRVDELKPGDLVFYKTLRRAFSHVGIYLGNNRFIHAPSTGGTVRVDDMTEGYWSARFNGARRME